VLQVRELRDDEWVCVNPLGVAPSPGRRSICAGMIALCAIASVTRGAEDLAFDIISPDTFDLTVHAGQPFDETIAIRGGTAPIHQLVIVPTTLTDPATTHRVQIARQDLGGCAAGLECRATVTFPRPRYAGAYAGSLTVSADGLVRRSVPVMIRTRGPNTIPGLARYRPFTHLPRLPAVLFWIVTLGGFALSSVLDAWFAGGGRRRVQARLLLARVREKLTRNLVRVAEWRQRLKLDALRANTTRWQLDLAEVERLDGDFAEPPIEGLELAVNRLALHADAAAVLWSALTIATDKLAVAPDRLQVVAAGLDALDPDSYPTVSDYAAACKGLLERSEGTQAERGAMVSKADVALPSVRQLARLRWQMRWMDRLYAFVGWLVVGLIAYVTFFDRAWTFGTARDYINVFLWTLGLTQTGSLILARGKSSFAKL
jgi:hypothetical protein